MLGTATTRKPACEVTILYSGPVPILLFNTSAKSSYIYIWHISYRMNAFKASSLPNERLHNFVLFIIRTMKPKRMIWAKQAAYIDS
jgi:hypothetical protein